METTDKNKIELLHSLLKDRSFLPVDEVYRLVPDEADEDFRVFYSELAAVREILRQFAGGNVDNTIPVRGAIAGYLKTLQANLRHLTWQVEQVAAGDFTQRVDFLGDFSDAINNLTAQLEKFVAEQKEREASERTQIMLDATPLCCNFWDENMNNVDCNLEAAKLFELGSKQEYLDRFNELSPEFQPSGRRSDELAREKIKEAFLTGRTVFEWMHQKPNGEPIPAEITLVRVQQKDHYIVAGYTRDLRELKKTQGALERERLVLLDILNTSPVSFAILVDGTVRFANPFMKDFLGIEANDELADFFAVKDVAAELYAELEQEDIINWRPVTMRTKGGEIKETLANMFMTDYYNARGTMVWLVDVTQIRQIEADLRRAKETAEDLARIKGEFLANMSHEIRTPMNAILGMMHLVQNTSLSDKQQEYIETAEKSAQLLLRIINDILDFSKIEAGKLAMESGVFSVQTAVDEVISVVSDLAEKKRLRLNVKVDSLIPSMVLGDAIRLKQVLLNLLNNAIKFTQKGYVELEVQLDKLEVSRVALIFKVKDTGIGLSEEERQKLFIPFNQADTSTTRKYGGTGLGLAISKSLVEMMHGTLGCESRKDEGSVFYFNAFFDLPKPSQDVEIPGMEDLADLDLPHQDVYIPEHLRGLKILLAEDNVINQMVATELLEAKGFKVDVANNGREAIEMLGKKAYGLVLMDIQMPEMDGLQAIKIIRQNPAYASLPVLAMTANAMGGDRELCLNAGMNDHIPKPINPVTLYESIIKWARANR